MLTDPDVEETSTPAFSSLRSKFEKLAVDTSPNISAHRFSSSHDLLAPEPGSPRPRAMSNTADDLKASASTRSLRAASSSSDLKLGGKRPPPPPPARSSRGNSPAPSASASPLIHPVADSSAIPAASLALDNVHPKTGLLSRKPPPPPLSHHDPFDDSPGPGVSSLINKFGNVPTAPSSQLLSSSRSPYTSLRVSSHSSATLSPSVNNSAFAPESNAVADMPRAPRHSFPLSQPSKPPNPRIHVQSVAAVDLDMESPVPSHRPPLPCRKNGPVNEQNQEAVHGRSASSDSITSNESGVASADSSTSQGEMSTLPVLSPPTRPPSHPPPRPPPRSKITMPLRPPSVASITSVSSSPSSGTPPPLPARKGFPGSGDDSLGRRVPPPRHRSTFEIESQHSSVYTPNSTPLQTSPTDGAPITLPPPITTSSIIQPTERKAFGAHPPPPTRIIALGDKLPPARRLPSGSSSESEEDDLKIKVDLLPDSSRSSRRPPIVDSHNYSEFSIWVPAYTGVVAVSGHTVAVAAHHHLKIYDLSESDAPLHDLDARSMGLETKTKDFKITSMEFRPATKAADRGSFLWVGTKDGHLLELDIRGGLVNVVGMKPIHSHTVTHMFRHGRSMVTMDDTGKVLVFTPDPDGDVDAGLAYTQPRVVRIAEKQEFAKILGGYLWTSARDPSGNGAGNTSRSPIVRVYDIFTPGSAGKSLLPTEHLGTVTSGTVMQSQKDQVFLGHEGGNVSIWSLDTEDGIPQCREVVKVSTSDVLSLEGVNDRLWAGGRKGMIAAYDVVPRPWVMTNNWMAHQKLPVLKLVVDTWSIEKLERLSVYSVGRDERLRFWDGLLGTDWIDKELLKRETEFSAFRDLNVLIVSWNLDSAKPDALKGTAENVKFLQEALSSVDSPDIIAFGLQELIDLESRKMAAKTVLLGGKGKNPDGAISQRVTTSYKKWYDQLVHAVRLAMPADTPYTVISTESLVGLFSCIFVKDTQRISLKQVAITTIKRGMGGRYGNKGGIVARFVIDDSSICFINCHLAAGQSHVRQRNADVAAMLEDKELFPESGSIQEPLAYVNGGDGSMVLDHEIVFLNGDMNYRIDLRRDAVVADVKAGNYAHLLSQDQLMKEMRNNRGFRLRTFMEGPLIFPPTYKYDRQSDEYDSSEKRRVPAWCDRILWRSREPSRVQQLHYRRYEVNVSDHRPISAGFRMTIKSVDAEPRAHVKRELEVVWAEHEKSLLEAAYRFYGEQAML